LTDPVRARQVLVNLIGNAIKFTHAGEVHLHVAREISYFGQLIRFTITDTGIGMTMEQVERLFSPFSQADASTTRKFGGTGLGLTISKKLAQILGGDISAHSRPNRGSTFAFWLDGGSRDDVEILSHFTEAQLDLPEPALGNDKQITLSGNVLLAEDGEDNQHLLTIFLEQAGANVTVASNGADAVRLALAGGFDLVLMDMQMPVMDGYRAASELRKAKFDKPVIALTAHAMAEDRSKCLAAGCTDYMTKPVDRQKLLLMCRSHLGRNVYPLREKEAAEAVAGEAPKADQAASATPEYPILQANVATAVTSQTPATSEVTTISSTPVAEPTPAISAATPPNHATPSPALRSTLASDPRVRKVLDGFISRLPQRVAEMSRCVEGEDLKALTQAVHQLKGAGSGYGFAMISELAGRAESALKAEQSLEAIRRDIESLIAMIRSVDGYNPSAEALNAVAATPK